MKVPPKTGAPYLIAAAMLLGAGTAQAESYLCEVDLSIGLVQDQASKKWSGEQLSPGAKHLIRKATVKEASSFSAPAWIVVTHGADEDAPVSHCPKFLGPQGWLTCEGRGGRFKFNRSTLRFIATTENGYWNDVQGAYDGLTNTPSMSAGKCSRID